MKTGSVLNKQSTHLSNANTRNTENYRGKKKQQQPDTGTLNTERLWICLLDV